MMQVQRDGAVRQSAKSKTTCEKLHFFSEHLVEQRQQLEVKLGRAHFGRKKKKKDSRGLFLEALNAIT